MPWIAFHTILTVWGSLTQWMAPPRSVARISPPPSSFQPPGTMRSSHAPLFLAAEQPSKRNDQKWNDIVRRITHEPIPERRGEEENDREDAEKERNVGGASTVPRITFQHGCQTQTAQEEEGKGSRVAQ